MSALRERLQRLARLDAAKLPIGRDEREVDVLDLVHWVYRDQKAHIVDGRGIGLHEGEKVAARVISAAQAGGGSVLRGVAEIGNLGCVVQRQGYDMGELHPVAETVHGIVAWLQRTGRAAGRLVVEHAQKGEIPSGATLEPKLQPSWKSSGPRWHWVKVRRETDGAEVALRWPAERSFRMAYDDSRERMPLYCPLEEDFGPDYVAAERRDYVAWHDALRLLVAECDALTRDLPLQLGGLVVTGPVLAREPWLDKSARQAAE